MKKTTDFLQTTTPEEFANKLMKCPRGGKVLLKIYELGLEIAKKDPLDRKGQYIYGTQEFIGMKDDFRRLILSELNHVFENEE